MKHSDNSSSGTKRDPSVDKSPLMKYDNATSGSRQKPEPDVEEVPKDKNHDSLPVTRRPMPIKLPLSNAKIRELRTERCQMNRYSPAARTNYSVKSKSARHREMLASGINLDYDSSFEDKEESNEDEDMAEEEEMEEEDLKLGKQVVTVDDGMEYEESRNDDNRHHGSSSSFIPYQILTHQKLIEELSKPAFLKKMDRRKSWNTNLNQISKRHSDESHFSFMEELVKNKRARLL